MAAISISSAFDAGNCNVVDCSKPDDIQIELREEPYTPYDKIAHKQWFHFRVSNVRGQALTIRIVNAGKASFPECWPGYKTRASYDCQKWFKVETSYDVDKGELVFKLASERDSVWFAYWAPYSLSRHQDFVASLQQSRPELIKLESVGQSLDGRDIDVLRIGDGSPAKKVVWVVSRQHPGESMAEWLAEGMLRRLADPHDLLVLRLLKMATVYVVPNINPDGSVRGHHRTNAKGANLNREWDKATLDYSPEVVHVLRKMEETGCHFFMDVHGDEEVTYNFMAGQEGTPSFNPQEESEEDLFTQVLMRVSPDFKPTNFYGVDAPNAAEMGEANNYVGEKFGCLSVTLEQPFKDVDSHEDPLYGWSPERAMRFGADCLMAIYQTLSNTGDKVVGKGPKQGPAAAGAPAAGAAAGGKTAGGQSAAGDGIGGQRAVAGKRGTEAQGGQEAKRVKEL